MTAGRVTITIPRNDGGRGYVCYSRAGIGGDFAIQGHSVTQDYEGAPDLDIKPADSTQFVQVCRVWAAQGKPIRASLRYDASSWTECNEPGLGTDRPNRKPDRNPNLHLEVTRGGPGCHRHNDGLAHVPNSIGEPSRSQSAAELQAVGHLSSASGIVSMILTGRTPRRWAGAG